MKFSCKLQRASEGSKKFNDLICLQVLREVHRQSDRDRHHNRHIGHVSLGVRTSARNQSTRRGGNPDGSQTGYAEAKFDNHAT